MSKVIDLNSYRTKLNLGQSNKININNTIMGKNKLYILIGIPCSGKSTYANEYLNNSHTIIVSSDKIRKDLTGTYKFSSENNNLVFDIAKKQVQNALSNGFDAVVDATNTNRKYRKNFIKISNEYNCNIIAIVFKTPLALCLKRNSKRDNDRRVPEQIIIEMSEFDSKIKESDGFDEIKYI